MRPPARVADQPLSPGDDTLVVLDTCALLPPRLSDVLFDLALEGLYLPHWTAEIEAESRSPEIPSANARARVHVGVQSW